MHRHCRFDVGTLLAVIGVLVSLPCALEAQDSSRSTPLSREELASFEKVTLDLVKRWRLPGGQLAVAKDGRLVFDRAYGYADIEFKERVETKSLFRIGSVSKTITTAAVLALVDGGRCDWKIASAVSWRT